MKSASSSELKKQLQQKNHEELVNYCLRLSKFKKENKELLTFLLFESGNLSDFTNRIRKEIKIFFTEMNLAHVYYVKKSLRKILRNVSKYSRISGSKLVESELCIEVCLQIKNLPNNIASEKQVIKIYNTLLERIETLILSLHPDLQYDLKKQLEKI
ncbi:MAG: hypothetical protein ABIO82_02220 [Ginsengibacter sp.]